jgi:cytidine deaminase
MDWEHLMQKAASAAEHAWCPYSGFKVGAVLLTERGGIFTGCNVENASYGLTQCAERTAICTAVAAEGPSMKLAQLAIVAHRAEFPPCGACRQVMAEFASAATQVAFWQGGKICVMAVAQLLPAGFTLKP